MFLSVVPLTKISVNFPLIKISQMNHRYSSHAKPIFLLRLTVVSVQHYFTTVEKMCDK